MFNPQQSETYPGHYYSFLEMCELDPTLLKIDDSEMPSCQGSDLGKCTICPAYSFTSKTEKKRHMKVFHRRQPQDKPLNHTCGVCEERFSSLYKLRKHKKTSGHFKRKRKEQQGSGKQSACKRARTMTPIIASAGKEHTEGDVEEESGNEEDTEEEEMVIEEGIEEGTEGDIESEEDEEERTDHIEHVTDDEDELCIVCGKGETDDTLIETWVQCETCSNWLHEKCIPCNHVYSVYDEVFICHICKKTIIL